MKFVRRSRKPPAARPRPPEGKDFRIMTKVKRILTVAESDSCGGSGIQADIKTITALGGYAATAVTAITVQNSKGLHDEAFMPPGLVTAQMRAVLEDIGVDAIKTGAMGSVGMIDAVADILDDVQERSYIVVVDPAMVARGGKALLDHEGVAALKRRLLVRASVIIPNRREAELLTGMNIRDLDEMRHAADMMRTLGADAVVLKGGVLNSESVVDLLAWDGGEEVYESPLQNTRHTHGAGCTLAAALTTCLAQGDSLRQAMETALFYLNTAIATAPGFGEGAGPVNHSHIITDKIAKIA